jgi:hypothetical protein
MSDDLPDPAPENIDGSKVVQYSHEVHHRVNWGYVALGLAVIAVLLFVRENVDLSSDDEQAEALA